MKRNDLMAGIQTKNIDFKTDLAEKAELVNIALADMLAGQSGIPDPLVKALDYTLKAPGKRIRAAIVLWACELVAGKINDAAMASAVAVEMIHTYSLVHDDLPSMDDDDMRRGQPTCHKAFDEATAILTGDALLTLAFEILVDRVEDASTAVRLVKTLARAAGPAGMIAGQVDDIHNQNTDGSVDLLQKIHVNKTARMFAASAAMGAISASADDEQVEKLYRYGLDIGLGFQIADDILDVSSTSEHLGKTAGKDELQGKITYPKIVGMDESRNIAEQIRDRAIAALDTFDSGADILRQLAAELLQRTR